MGRAGARPSLGCRACATTRCKTGRRCAKNAMQPCVHPLCTPRADAHADESADASADMGAVVRADVRAALADIGRQAEPNLPLPIPAYLGPWLGRAPAGHCAQIAKGRDQGLSETRPCSAVRDIHSKATEGRFLVLLVHVAASLAHRLDTHIKADQMLPIAAH